MHHQCSWSAHRRIDQCFHRRSKNWCCRRLTVAATLDPIETVCGVSLHMNASGLASPHHLEADSRTWQINESVVPIAAKVQYQDTRSSQGEGQPTAREGPRSFFSFRCDGCGVLCGLAWLGSALIGFALLCLALFWFGLAWPDFTLLGFAWLRLALLGFA